MNVQVRIFGKQSQYLGTYLMLGSIAFRFVVGLYLCASAAWCIADLTGIPAWLLMVVEALLCVQFPGKPVWVTLRRSHADMVMYALLLLGSAYRVAGQTTGISVCLVIGYWVAVLLAIRKRK